MEKGVSDKITVEPILQKALNGHYLSFLYMTINWHLGANDN